MLLKSHRLGHRATLEIDDLVDTPLLVTRRGFASREWFDTATQVGHMRPHLLLESAAPSTLVALAQAGYGIAIVASTVRIPLGRVRAVPLVQRGAPIGRWLSIASDPRRFLAPFAEQFVEELVAHSKRAAAAKLGFTRRLPLLPRPKEVTSIHESPCYQAGPFFRPFSFVSGRVRCRRQDRAATDA